jgi:hypothetical protein
MTLRREKASEGASRGDHGATNFYERSEKIFLMSSVNNIETDEGPPIDEVDELLVAYLDGELDEPDRIALEERLVAEEPLRQRMTALQSGWEMLDALPVANVTEDFARTTVELVAAGQSRMLRAHKRQRPWLRIGWLSLAIFLTAAGGLIGYAIPEKLHDQRFAAQLDDLPLAEHLDAYLLDVDLGLIESLSVDPVWQESMRLASDSGGIVLPTALDLAQRDPDQRVASVKNSDRETRVKLSTNWDRLQSLSDERLQQVRQRADQVRETRSPSLTLLTLEQYAQWWHQLSPENQDEIYQAAAEEKIDVIRAQVQRSSRRWVRNYAMTLGETDRIPIQQQLLLIASDRIELAKKMADQDEEGSTDFRSSPWWDISPERLLDVLAWRSNMRGMPNPPRDEQSQRVLTVLFGPPTNDELAAIEVLLSRQALAILNAESGSDSQRRETLWSWCMEIVQQMASNSSSAETVLNRYQSLDDDLRESLDLATPGRILNELRGRRWGPPRR